MDRTAKIYWEKELDEDTYIRLCECRNTRKDLITLSKVVKKVRGVSSEEALETMLEWVGDWNGQYEVTDLTDEQYERILKAI